MNKIKLFTLLALFTSLTTAFASNLEKEMKDMDRQVKAFSRAKDADGLRQAAGKLQISASKAKEIIPDDIKDNPESTKDYQMGLQKVIDAAKQAENLAMQGKVKEAKAAFSALSDLKKEYHRKYK